MNTPVPCTWFSCSQSCPDFLHLLGRSEFQITSDPSSRQGPEDEVLFFVAVEDIGATLKKAEEWGHDRAIGARGPLHDVWCLCGCAGPPSRRCLERLNRRERSLPLSVMHGGSGSGSDRSTDLPRVGRRLRWRL